MNWRPLSLFTWNGKGPMPMILFFTDLRNLPLAKQIIAIGAQLNEKPDSDLSAFAALYGSHIDETTIFADNFAEQICCIDALRAAGMLSNGTNYIHSKPVIGNSSEISINGKIIHVAVESLIKDLPQRVPDAYIVAAILLEAGISTQLPTQLATMLSALGDSGDLTIRAPWGKRSHDLEVNQMEGRPLVANSRLKVVNNRKIFYLPAAASSPLDLRDKDASAIFASTPFRLYGILCDDTPARVIYTVAIHLSKVRKARAQAGDTFPIVKFPGISTLVNDSYGQLSIIANGNTLFVKDPKLNSMLKDLYIQRQAYVASEVNPRQATIAPSDLRSISVKDLSNCAVETSSDEPVPIIRYGYALASGGIGRALETANLLVVPATSSNNITWNIFPEEFDDLRVVHTYENFVGTLGAFIQRYYNRPDVMCHLYGIDSKDQRSMFLDQRCDRPTGPQNRIQAIIAFSNAIPIRLPLQENFDWRGLSVVNRILLYKQSVYTFESLYHLFARLDQVKVFAGLLGIGVSTSNGGRLTFDDETQFSHHIKTSEEIGAALSACFPRPASTTTPATPIVPKVAATPLPSVNSLEDIWNYSPAELNGMVYQNNQAKKGSSGFAAVLTEAGYLAVRNSLAKQNRWLLLPTFTQLKANPGVFEDQPIVATVGSESVGGVFRDKYWIGTVREFVKQFGFQRHLVKANFYRLEKGGRQRNLTYHPIHLAYKELSNDASRKKELTTLINQAKDVNCIPLTMVRTKLQDDLPRNLANSAIDMRGQNLAGLFIGDIEFDRFVMQLKVGSSAWRLLLKRVLIDDETGFNCLNPGTNASLFLLHRLTTVDEYRSTLKMLKGYYSPRRGNLEEYVWILWDSAVYSSTEFQGHVKNGTIRLPWIS